MRLRYVAALECAHVIPSRSLAVAAVCRGSPAHRPDRWCGGARLTTSFRHPEPCHTPSRSTQCSTTRPNHPGLPLRPTPLTAAPRHPDPCYCSPLPHSITPHDPHHSQLLHASPLLTVMLHATQAIRTAPRNPIPHCSPLHLLASHPAPPHDPTLNHFA